jgi:hypothetical protein
VTFLPSFLKSRRRAQGRNGRRRLFHPGLALFAGVQFFVGSTHGEQIHGVGVLTAGPASGCFAWWGVAAGVAELDRIVARQTVMVLFMVEILL